MANYPPTYSLGPLRIFGTVRRCRAPAPFWDVAPTNDAAVTSIG
jgi:hypothetical protein